MTLGVTAQPTGPRGVDADEVVTRLRSAGVPRRFEECRLVGFRNRSGLKPALDAAEVLADDADGRNLVLSGQRGTGKTHLAVGVLAARIEAHLAMYPEPIREIAAPPDSRPGYDRPSITVRPNLALRFVVVPSFLDRLRAAMRYGDTDDPMPSLFEADLLVLDDLGREKATDWATERLYVLVNERYNRVLPTIVTTNEDLGELIERGYGALVSRLMEGGDLIRIDATDYRLRGGR